jgi:CPA1 family monovalent cation:H+ antiporter
MEFLNLLAILITLSAVFSYLNHRFIGLPTTIGVMLIALIFSLVLIGLNVMGIGEFETQAELMLSQIDFSKVLMHGMLSFLLFAGALHVNFADLSKFKWIITSLATLGIVLSTFIVGTLIWILLKFLEFDIAYIYCLLFGALISPTDPIAVMATLKTVGIAKSLETKITGESLFNDGVGVVIFLVLLSLAYSPEDVSAGEAALLFVQEAVGGVLFGVVLGYIGFYLLRTVDNYQVEILLTLALVMGGYTLALALHTSGPIAIVVAGLMIGNKGRALAMSDKTREHLDTFWELIDEILNAVLFVLIGLEMLILDFSAGYITAGLLAIPLVLMSRFFSVGIPVSLLRLKKEYSPHVVKILVWGGLRGGISVALALSLPMGETRDVFLAMTYIIVVFSILVQGLTIAPMLRRLSG